MGTVAAYTRVSTRSQVDDRSHLRQRERISEWATRNGHSPGDWGSYHTGEQITDKTDWDPIDDQTTGDITWFEDIAASGQSLDREAHDRLMDTYRDFEIVVVRELSRFGRSPEKNTQQIIDIAEAGVDFVSLSETFDTTTANGRLMLRIINDFNGWFADQRREQAEEMIERRREQGKPIGRPKKLSESEIEQVLAWREKDLSYGMIATLVEEQFDVEISRETARRYCTEAA